MNRTTSDLAFIQGYMLVANSTAGVSLTLDDPSWDDVLAEHRHLFDVSPRYHEAHITVQPPEGHSFTWFREQYGQTTWRVSRFEDDDVDHIEGMWFLSSRDPSFSALVRSLSEVLRALVSDGYTVVRYKVEDTVLDSKFGDTL